MKSKQYVEGMKAGIPVLFGFIPIGIAYAIMAGNSGFGFGEIVLMSVCVFGDASQMMAVGMYAQGAGLAAIILATFILNLRHFIMSTCVFSNLKQKAGKEKFVAAYGVTDESFAIFATTKGANQTIWFFLGMITVTYSSWVLSGVLGAIAANFLPEALSQSLGIALYAMFLGLLIPSVKNNLKLGILVVLTAVVNTLLSMIMASSWALIIATLLCAGAGVFFVELEETEPKEKRVSEGREAVNES